MTRRLHMTPWSTPFADSGERVVLCASPYGKRGQIANQPTTG